MPPLFDWIRGASSKLLTCFLAACTLAGLGAAPALATWSTPVDLSAHDQFGYGVTSAIDAGGDAAIVWERSIDSYHTAIDASLRAGGSGFSAPTRIDSGAWLSTDPMVAMASTGEAVAVFTQETGSSLYNIWAAVRAPGGPFGAPVELNDQAASPSNVYYPGVAVDASGDAFAFWQQNSQQEIYWALRPPGGAFGSPHAIVNPGTYAQDPHYAAGGNGDAVAAWADYGTVYAAVRQAGHAFGSGIALNSSDDARSSPSVGMDAAGNAVATWMACTDPCMAPKMEYSLRPAGGSFGPERTLAVATTNSYVPVLAMDRRGDVAIAWGGGATDPPLSSAGITVMIKPAGGTFGPPEDIGSNGAYDDPRLVWDDAGDLFASWRRYQGSGYEGRALAAVRPAGGHFSGDEETLSETDKNVWPTALAAAGNGHALAAWAIGYFNGDASTFWIQGTDWLGAAPAQAESQQPTPVPTGAGSASASDIGIAGGPRSGPPGPVAAAAGPKFGAAIDAPADVDPLTVKRHGLSFSVRCSNSCSIRARICQRRSHRLRCLGRPLARASRHLARGGRASFRLRIPLAIVRAAVRHSPVRLVVAVDVTARGRHETLVAPVALDRGRPLSSRVGR